MGQPRDVGHGLNTKQDPDCGLYELSVDTSTLGKASSELCWNLMSPKSVTASVFELGEVVCAD